MNALLHGCSLQKLVPDDELSIRRCIATPTLMVSPTSSGTRQDLLGLTLVLCAAAVPLNFFQIQNIYAVVIEPHIITLSFSKTATWIELRLLPQWPRDPWSTSEEINIISSISNPLNRFKVWLKKKLVILVVPGARKEILWDENRKLFDLCLAQHAIYPNAKP